jgi:pimeloyl-ACP methyl ester carboxylesterase
MIAEVNGVRLGYSDTGSGSPVLLLVHGFPLNRSMWEPQLGTLRERARVIVPDLRGFGASESGPPGPLTMDQHADDLAALLDVLEVREPVVFCGLSMGGYIAFPFWKRHRERVAAFVLADTRATPDGAEERERRLAMADEVERSGSAQAALDLMLPRLFAPSLWQGAPARELVRAMVASTAARSIADGARGVAARPDSLDVLPGMDVPSLVIVGEHDLITPPAESTRMVERLPNARLEVIPQAGHMANFENTDAFNEALAGFLSALGRRPGVSSQRRDGG